MTSRPTTTRHPRAMANRREVEESDVRWLVTTALIFAASLALCLGLYALYRQTGPHPQVILFLRAVRRAARWLTPGL